MVLSQCPRAKLDLNQQRLTQLWAKHPNPEAIERDSALKSLATARLVLRKQDEFLFRPIIKNSFFKSARRMRYDLTTSQPLFTPFRAYQQLF